MQRPRTNNSGGVLWTFKYAGGAAISFACFGLSRVEEHRGCVWAHLVGAVFVGSLVC